LNQIAIYTSTPTQWCSYTGKGCTEFKKIANCGASCNPPPAAH